MNPVALSWKSLTVCESHRKLITTCKSRHVSGSQAVSDEWTFIFSQSAPSFINCIRVTTMATVASSAGGDGAAPPRVFATILPVISALGLLFSWLLTAMNKAVPEPYMVPETSSIVLYQHPPHYNNIFLLVNRTRFSTFLRLRNTAEVTSVRRLQFVLKCTCFSPAVLTFACSACRRVGPQDHDVPRPILDVDAVH